MARYLLDETGEVLYEFKDNEKIIIYDSLNTKRNIINNKLFYKLYKDSLLIFINEHISQKVFKTLFGLIRLLDFNTNEFVSFNGLPATIGQLCKYFNMTNKTFYNHIRQLEKLEILKKVKKGREVNILINPYFISYGTKHTDEALKIFANTIWAKSSVYSKRKRKGDYSK